MAIYGLPDKLRRWIGLFCLVSLFLAGCSSSQSAPFDGTPRIILPMIQSDSGQVSPTPALGTFAARVELTASAQTVSIGETITLTATLINESQGCQYPPYEMSLQVPAGAALTFLTPQVVGPPAPVPVVFQVRLEQAGTLEVFAQAYGERNCGDGWVWTYVGSDPLTIEAVAP